MHHSEMHISEHTCPRLKTNMSKTHVRDSGQTHLTHIQHGRHTCWSTHVRAHMLEHTCQSTHVRAHMLEHTCRSTHVGAHMSEHICPGLRENMSETQSKHVRDARQCVLLSQHVIHLSARNTHTAPCLAHLGAY